MNCIVLEPTEAPAATSAVEIRGRRARHVIEVLRAEPGQRVRVGVLGGRLGHAVLASLSDDSVVLESIELDTEPREVDVPADLEAALDAEAKAAFERMSYTHRKEYAEWIEEAKRPETRERRVAKAVEMIREGKPQR